MCEVILSVSAPYDMLHNGPRAFCMLGMHSTLEITPALELFS